MLSVNFLKWLLKFADSFRCYSLSSALDTPGSTPFRSSFLLEDLDELSKLSVISSHLIIAPDVSSAALSIPMYTEENLEHIFKTVLEVQAPA